MSDIIPVTESPYALAQRGPEKASAIISGAVEGGIGRLDLPVVKVPSGGVNFFTVPDKDGNDAAVKTLIGVELACQAERNRFKPGKPGEISDEPPLCSSPDGVTGHGDPGGECAKCHYAKFGENGEKPECKIQAALLVQLPDRGLPLVVQVPVTSSRNLRKYRTLLASGLVSPGEVEIEIGLTEEKSEGGIKYNALTFRKSRTLTEAEAATFAAVSQAAAPLAVRPIRRD